MFGGEMAQHPLQMLKFAFQLIVVHVGFPAFFRILSPVNGAHALGNALTYACRLKAVAVPGSLRVQPYSARFGC